jgi:hypothetical protein
MARAPTRLKALFYKKDVTPDGIRRTLAAAGCLSTAARRDRRTVTHLIRTTLLPTEGPPVPGPSPADRLESALSDAGYLNDRGLEWSHTIVGPDWTEPLEPLSLGARLKRWLAALRDAASQ